MPDVNVRVTYDPIRKELSGVKKPLTIHQKGLGHLFYHNMVKHAEDGLDAQIDVATGHADSFRNLLKRCVRTALTMREMGIVSGDIIMICSYNHLNAVVPFVAAQFIGAITSTTDPSLSLDDTKHLVNLVKPKLIFVSQGSETLIEQATSHFEIPPKIISFSRTSKFLSFDHFLRPHLDEEHFEPYIVNDTKETTLILFSSGTTGLPKGICLNHEYLIACTAGLDSDGTGYTQQNQLTFLGFASLYWVSSVSISAICLRRGCRRVVASSFEPEQLWNICEKYNVVVMFLAPIQVIRAIPYIPNNIQFPKFLMVGGSAISMQYLQLLREKLPNTIVAQGYGQTEVGFISSFKNNDECDNNLKSCGFLFNNLTLKVVDPETEERLGFNQVGEIRVKSSTMMNGYYHQDSSSCWDDEGFLKTGDLGYFDEDLRLYLTDRIKEMFKYLSWHIVPAKTEEILYTHPEVQMAVVVGVPHPIEDNHAMGLVMVAPGAKVTGKELELYVEERVDERNRLRAGVKILETMPFTPSGKVQRRELRQNWKQYLKVDNN